MKGFYLLLVCCFIFSLSFSQIQSNAVKKASRIVKSENFRSLSNENGYYLMPNFGMRYGPFYEDQYSGIQDLSLYYGFGFGYRKQNLSLESGLSFFHHESTPTYVIGDERILGHSGTGALNLILPFTFRYDIPMGEKENVRIGAFLNSNLTVFGFENDIKSRSGQFQTQEGELLDYTLDLIKKSPFFFKTGIHSRVRVFNSAFLNFEIGHFFALGPNRVFDFTLGNNEPVQLSRSWEGISWTIGGILPMNVFGKKLKGKV